MAIYMFIYICASDNFNISNNKKKKRRRKTKKNSISTTTNFEIKN